MGGDLDQRQFSVRMEWGLRGAEAISREADYAVVVDVLSFTTAVSVALDQHIEVFPYPWRDESAVTFAREQRAALAVSRREAATTRPGQSVPVSLSPASVRAASGLDRIVLPSPNGSALAVSLAESNRSIQILAACLRNRTAVASFLAGHRASRGGLSNGPRAIAVVAAGERWPDNSIRPAAEDLWGAGAVIAALVSLGVTGLSPEARSAAAAWRAIELELGAALARCSSGAELAEAGFGADVAIAGELDSSPCVPHLSAARFTDAVRRDRDNAS